MVDYIKLGMMSAEFKDDCIEIDKAFEEANSKMMQDAWDALKDNNLKKRDILTEKIKKLPEVVQKAKAEAWERIADRHGLDVEASKEALRRMQN